MAILNLTQHAPSPEQVREGVVNLPPETWQEVKRLMTFEEIPDIRDLPRRARAIVAIATEYFDRAGLPYHIMQRRCMIGGAPYFQSYLEREMAWKAIQPLYAFSRRESVDEMLPDGSVVKRAVFRHVGWIAPDDPYEGYR